MRKLVLISIFILAASVFFSSPAHADKITAIQTSPASPQEGDKVTVTLQGTGNCKTLDLDWGDGTGHYFSQPPNQNYSVGGMGWALPPHPYANAGTFTIKVVSVKGCQGTGLTKILTVAKKMVSGGGIIDLCKYIDCGALFAPKISNFLIFSNFTPGGAIAVLGSGFGNNQGQLHMVGTTVGSFKITDTVVPIIQGGWSNKSIGATIPNLTGVVEQPIKFYVVTAGNAKSNDSFTVQFRPTQEMKQLPSGDVQVGCSDEADFDSCNSVVNDDGIPFCGAPFVSGGGGSMSAFHWTCVGSSNGTDSYSASLKNGWLFSDAALVDLTPEDLFSNDPKFANMSGFQSDVASTNVTVNWNNADASYVLYSVNVSIVGPKGVPHK